MTVGMNAENNGPRQEDPIFMVAFEQGLSRGAYTGLAHRVAGCVQSAFIIDFYIFMKA